MCVLICIEYAAGIKELSILQHCTGNCKEQIADRSQGASVVCPHVREGFVLGFADGIVLDGHSDPNDRRR